MVTDSVVGGLHCPRFYGLMIIYANITFPLDKAYSARVTHNALQHQPNPKLEYKREIHSS